MKKQTVVYSAVAVSLMVLSFILGFMSSNNDTITNRQMSAANTKKIEENQPDSAAPEPSTAAVATVSDGNEPISTEKITPSTKMVYEYYYLGDGKTEATEEVPPYFLLDMTEEDVRDTFIDWDILSFNTAEVVMRKNVQGKSNQYYVVGEHEGFIAVFYETETNGTTLKEITDMPISAFSEDEQERLRSGIHVSGNTELIKVLEDYGS